jgi:uncharacterized protein YgbK (DUF1537 family)
MRHIAIIADDLTGACDSGAQFVSKALRTTVLFDTENLVADTADVDVVAVDTESRAIAATEAYTQVRRAATSVAASGFAHIYKKVDSTLRGNLGSEIDAVMDAVHFDLAVVAPAFPRVGRTTRGGIHYLNGVRIEQTEIARDPKCPVTQSRITELLATQSRRQASEVGLGALRAGKATVHQAIAEILAAGTELVVFDAEREGDLQQIATVMADSAYRVLWVGSAGLAEYLPRVLGIGGGTRGERVAMPMGAKPAMLVAGSISETTRAQVALVRAQPGVVTVELDPVAVLTEGPERELEVGRCCLALSGALAEGLDVLLTAGSSPEQVAAAQAEGVRLGLDGTTVSNRIALGLGKVAAAVLTANDVQGCILTGGDTAKAVCRQLGVTGLRLVRELEAGVALSRMVGGKGLMTVTKAGAFGNEGTLLRAMRALKGEG